MRERRATERKKLPGSAYEEWLGGQSPGRTTKAHRTPAPDIYETWVEERVRQRISAAKEKAD